MNKSDAMTVLGNIRETGRFSHREAVQWATDEILALQLENLDLREYIGVAIQSLEEGFPDTAYNTLKKALEPWKS